MITRILIAIDGSSQSIKAAKLGSQIAAAMNLDLVLLHVVPHKRVPNAIEEFAKTEQLPGTDVEKLIRGAQKFLEDRADKARAIGVKKILIEVEKGPVARTIIETVKRTGADMIVMGSRGTGELGGLLPGGASHRVEIMAKCPVLVVK